MSDTQPLAYLMTSSDTSLESYELSRLNRASNLRKEMLQLLEKWIDAEAEARMARAILEWKRAEIRDPTGTEARRIDSSGARLVDTKAASTRTKALRAREGEVPGKMLQDQSCGTELNYHDSDANPRLRGKVLNTRRASSALRLLEQFPRPARGGRRYAERNSAGRFARLLR